MRNWRFPKVRPWVVLVVLAVIYALAFLGVWVAVYVPFLGGPFFLIGLMIWYVPGVLFAWTGWFAFHEFGAAPAGWPGHVVMFLFYLAIAVALSLPFGRRPRNAAT